MSSIIVLLIISTEAQRTLSSTIFQLIYNSNLYSFDFTSLQQTSNEADLTNINSAGQFIFNVGGTITSGAGVCADGRTPVCQYRNSNYYSLGDIRT